MVPPLSPEFTAWLWSQGWLLGLVAARAGGLVGTAPGFSSTGVGARFRVVAALLLVPVVAPGVLAADPVSSSPTTFWEFGPACLTEALIGAALGWTAALVIAGARQAGEIVGAQAGLAPAAFFDPEASGELTALGHLYGLVALGAFLAMDGPVALVKALVESYRVLPAGQRLATTPTVNFAFGRVGEALALSIRAAAPVALALVLAGLALGLLGRAAPSVQRAAMLGPLRSVIGLALVGLALATLAVTFANAWAAWPGAPLAF